MPEDGHRLNLPAIPLRDIVVYPFMVVPLFVGRKESIAALEEAFATDKRVFLVTQKNAKTENPQAKDLYKVGVIANVLQLLRLPDGTVKVLAEGLERATLVKLHGDDEYYSATVNRLGDTHARRTQETQALMRGIMTQFEDLIKVNKRIPVEVVNSLTSIEEPSRFADCVAAHITAKIETRQQLLRANDVVQRLEQLQSLLVQELDLLEVEKRIQGRVKNQVERNQRSYYLNEKIKAIQNELGDLQEAEPMDELKKLEKKINEVGMSQEAKEKALSELTKLKMMPPMSAEATVSRNYLDWLVDVPWQQQSEISNDLAQAQLVLDKDHYGLDKVKERILEYLAVQQRVNKLKGPILCLVGPPGVGKTSLGKSIAEATGREFVRFSLGGVRDEAEIRGHRRTYVGAMPGKVVQKLAKVKVKNPLFMLDELDKMNMDFRGDPASALLEVLDPEQNAQFNDHYLEVDYDLSDVMFVATSNSMDIPGPLLDRMEVIRLAGYTEQEKINIAQKYLVPKQIEQNGLKKSEISIAKTAIQEIIRSYTREAGVRSLEREIAKICRKVVKEILLNPELKKVKVNTKNLEEYLGVKKFRFGQAEKKNQVGQVTGLAWTQVGGEILTLESQIMPGKGKSVYTGSLGDVMQESIQAAMTVVRSRSKMLGVKEAFYQEHDFHVHVPEGATPKDGPSAGIGMCTALVSAITKIPVRSDVAMTGEITLRGEVLPIGGLKEKLLAALRAGIKHVVIPEENARDLKEIPSEVLETIEIHPVRWIDQVLELALERQPTPLVDSLISVKSGDNAVKLLKKAGKKAKESGRVSH